MFPSLSFAVLSSLSFSLPPFYSLEINEEERKTAQLV